MEPWKIQEDHLSGTRLLVDFYFIVQTLAAPDIRSGGTLLQSIKASMCSWVRPMKQVLENCRVCHTCVTTYPFFFSLSLLKVGMEHYSFNATDIATVACGNLRSSRFLHTRSSWRSRKGRVPLSSVAWRMKALISAAKTPPNWTQQHRVQNPSTALRGIITWLLIFRIGSL